MEGQVKYVEGEGFLNAFDEFVCEEGEGFVGNTTARCGASTEDGEVFDIGFVLGNVEESADFTYAGHFF